LNVTWACRRLPGVNFKHIDRWDRRTIEIALSQIIAARTELEEVFRNIDEELGRLRSENARLKNTDVLTLDD